MNRADKVVIASAVLYVVLLAILAMALSGCAVINPDAKRAHWKGDAYTCPIGQHEVNTNNSAFCVK